jgi:hypothetical protein
MRRRPFISRQSATVASSLTSSIPRLEGLFPIGPALETDKRESLALLRVSVPDHVGSCDPSVSSKHLSEIVLVRIGRERGDSESREVVSVSVEHGFTSRSGCTGTGGAIEEDAK